MNVAHRANHTTALILVISSSVYISAGLAAPPEKVREEVFNVDCETSHFLSVRNRGSTDRFSTIRGVSLSHAALVRG